MIGKNNKKLKELKQGVKVESYSIKKFKFGANRSEYLFWCWGS